MTTTKTTTQPGKRSRALRILSLVLPFIAVGAGMPVLASRIGDGMGRRLGAIAPLARPEAKASVSPPGAFDPSAPDAGGISPGVDAGAGGGLPVPVARPGQNPVVAHREPGEPRRLHIPAEAAARALTKVKRARATNAVDAQGKPVGVRLARVSDLGVGLREGDVITSVDGTLTPDVDTATAAALHVLAQGKRTVRATLVRDDGVWAVTADVPANDGGPLLP